MQRNHVIRIVCATAALVTAMLAAPASAYVTVYGGPTYTPGIGGFQFGGVVDINDAGIAIGTAYKYNGAGAELGGRAFRLDGSGSPATELGNLGMEPVGRTESVGYAINNAGVAVGYAHKYGGSDFGNRAVRWDASSVAATELVVNLGATFGHKESYPLALNDAGTAVGYAHKYGGSVDLGYRAVRWDASGTTATELGNLGTGTQFGVSGYTFSEASAINGAGIAVGYAHKYNGTGVDLGVRAVRWDASGTAATELENLGTQLSGYTNSSAYAINDAGTAVGDAWTYDASDTWLGARALRWDASGTAATELGNLGKSANGFAISLAVAINGAGTAVGFASKYDGSGADLGGRAVRWDASGTAPTELGNLGTNASGYTYCDAFAINDAGIVIGSAYEHDGSETYPGGPRPVYWGLDDVAVDLNTLIDPASGWTLNGLGAISNTGWVGGHGTFDPDGAGGQAAYTRMFLMHLPSTAVPEPATVVLFGIGLVGLSVASRRCTRRNVAAASN